VHLKLGQTEDALMSALRALELRPSWGKGHHRVATALRLDGKLEKAAESLIKCLSFDSNNSAASSELRELRSMIGDTLHVETKSFEVEAISSVVMIEKGSLTEKTQELPKAEEEAGDSANETQEVLKAALHDASIDQLSSDKKKSHPTGTHECANCGVMGFPFHACSRCKLVHYCCKACQTQHWKAISGHKRFCVLKEKWKAHSIGETYSSESNQECSICLAYVTGPTTCILPCLHTFHVKCVEDLRAFGVAQVCPMCRAKLPPGPEELFDEATRRFLKLEKQGSMGCWSSLSIAQREEVNEVTSTWRVAADQGPALPCVLASLSR